MDIMVAFGPGLPTQVRCCRSDLVESDRPRSRRWAKRGLRRRSTGTFGSQKEE